MDEEPDSTASTDSKLPVSEYGQKFNREQNVLFFLFIASVFGYLFLQGILDNILLQVFRNMALSGAFSWLLICFMVLLELFTFYRFHVGQIQKTNRFPVIHLDVYRKEGGKLTFHRAIKDVQVMEKHSDGNQTLKVTCAFCKGKPYEKFLVRTQHDWGQHTAFDSEEDVFIGFSSIRRPVATLSVKEAGFGRDDLPVVRIVDSAVAREDKELLTMTPERLEESVGSEDRWEARYWKGKFFNEKREHNTTEALRKDAVAAADRAKENAKEQDEIIPEENPPQPRIPSSTKTLILILIAAALTFLITKIWL